MSSNSAGFSASDWMLKAFKQNPEGLLLLAAGAVLMMRTTTLGSTKSMAGANQTGSSAAATVGDTASTLAEQTKETANSIASSASQYAGQARRVVGEQSERIAQQTQSALQNAVSRILKDQPLAIAIAGIAAGAAVAAAFPTTEIEKETLGPLGEQVTERAEQLGDQLKEATAKAGDKLKSAADQRGLNAEGLKGVASDVAGAFSSAMSGSKSDRNTKSGSEPANPSGGNKQYQP